MRTMGRLIALLLLAAAPGAAPLRAQAGPSEAAPRGLGEIRAAAAELLDQGVPGLSVAVAVDGEVAWTEGFGVADVELAAPVTPATRFGIGSISKSLTAVLLARLADAGKLDWDDPVETHLPAFPHAGRGVTLRRIAAHVSGLDDAFATAGRYASRSYTTDEALAEIYREPLRSTPGTEVFYATGTYTLLAGVVEKATGEGFLAAMRHRVLEPLALDGIVPNQRREIVAGRSRFYELDDDGRLINAPYFDPSHKWAGAGYLSTAADLARFGSALLEPGFLTPEALSELWRPVPPAVGGHDGFALGFRAERDEEGRPIVHQLGGGPGISCWLVLYPQQKLAVAVLANLSGAQIGPVVDATLETFLERVEGGAPKSE